MENSELPVWEIPVLTKFLYLKNLKHFQIEIFLHSYFIINIICPVVFSFSNSTEITSKIISKSVNLINNTDSFIDDIC